MIKDASLHRRRNSDHFACRLNSAIQGATFLAFRNLRAVASLASCRRRLVEKHWIVAHLLPEGVARRAGNILVAALQRERCFLVIEE